MMRPLALMATVAVAMASEDDDDTFSCAGESKRFGNESLFEIISLNLTPPPSPSP